MTASSPGSPLVLDSPESVRLMRLYDYSVKLLLSSLVVSLLAVQIFAAATALIAFWMLSRGFRYRRTPLDLPVIVFILVRILAVAVSEHPAMSVNALIRELPFYLVYFCFTFYHHHASERQVHSTFQWLFISTAVVAIIASGQMIAGTVERANGLSGGGTLAAHLSMTAAALVAFSAWNIFKRRWITYLLLAIFLVGQIFTITRGEWLATAAVLIIYYSVFNKRLMGAIAVLAVIAFLAIPAARERAATLAQPWKNSSDRSVLWENALRHAGEHPVLGFGPETFSAVFDNSEEMGDKKVDSWHNDVIHTYMESGAVGVASLLWLFGAMVFYSIKLLRISPRKCDPDEPLNATGWMGVVLMAAYLIGGMFSIPTFSITNAILFRFLLAMVGSAVAAAALNPPEEAAACVVPSTDRG